MSDDPDTDHHKRVGVAIERVKTIVERELSSVKRGALLDLIIASSIIILTVIAAFSSTFQGALASIGLGGISLASQWKRWVGALRVYTSQDPKRIGNLRKLIDEIETEYDLCPKHDHARLFKVEEMIRGFLDANARLAIGDQ